jgi:guanine deaminase
VQERFMRMAIDLAVKNAHAGDGGPFAALVVNENKVVASGVNRVTSANDPTAHAEVVAIREACRILGNFQLSSCDLYTSCEPCPMCAGAIYWARLARVFYAGTASDAAAAGFDDSFISEELRLAPGARRIPMTQVLRDESLAAFLAWQQNPNRIRY